MARKPLRPLIRGGGFYPSRKWTPLVYAGGMTTMADVGGGEPIDPLNTFSGAIASFKCSEERPLVDLTAAIEPVQDLHGYDSPWPAGGGKNKLPYPYYGTSGTINGVEFTDLGDGRLKINGTATARAVFLLENHNSVIQSGEYIVSRGTDVSGPRITVDAYNGNKWVKALATIAGDEQTITIDYDGYDRIDVFVSVVANTTVSNVIVAPMFRLSSVTDATFAPYSNICPISGRESVEVERTGKNLLGINEVYGDATGISITDDVATGNNVRFSGVYFYIPQYLVGKQLTLSAKVTVPSGVTAIFTQGSVNNVRVEGNRIPSNTTGVTSVSFTPESTNDFCRITYGGGSGNITVSDFQLELGSTATAYEPYQGETYSITFPSEAGTVYGGTLDVTTGKLTVDRAMVDLGTLNWNYNAGQLSMVSGDLASVVGNGANVVCSNYKTETNLRGGYWANTDKAVGINKANSTTTGSFALGALVVKDTYYSDAATFKTAVSGVQLVYELATPIEYTLTPTEVTTLLGTNNIWADTGDVTVQAYATAL